MKKIAVLILILIVFIAGGATGITNYNALSHLSEKVAAKQANMADFSQSRLDVIPKLVAAAKKYANSDAGIFDDVLKERDNFLKANTFEGQMQAASALDDSLAKMLSKLEDYPEFKSDENLAKLLDDLTSAENRIAIARRDYNEIASEYNRHMSAFPANIFAAIFKFNKAAHLKTGDSDSSATDADANF